jgi:hypothetical protein
MFPVETRELEIASKLEELLSDRYEVQTLVTHLIDDSAELQELLVNLILDYSSFRENLSVNADIYFLAHAFAEKKLNQLYNRTHAPKREGDE